MERVNTHTHTRTLTSDGVIDRVQTLPIFSCNKRLDWSEAGGAAQETDVSFQVTCGSVQGSKVRQTDQQWSGSLCGGLWGLVRWLPW